MVPRLDFPAHVDRVRLLPLAHSIVVAHVSKNKTSHRHESLSMTPLQHWMNQASTSQLIRLARLARTTVGTLRQISGRYRKSNTTAELAVRIDHAAAVLRSRDPTLPDIPRESLSAACRGCEFAKRCRKA
jgi:hypothetical protein